VSRYLEQSCEGREKAVHYLLFSGVETNTKTLCGVEAIVVERKPLFFKGVRDKYMNYDA